MAGDAYDNVTSNSVRRGLEPGDSLLQVVENSIVANDVNVSFQAVFLEQDADNLL